MAGEANPSSGSDAGDLASDALRAAQEAVMNMNQGMADGGTPISDETDDAATAALLAAQQAIAAARAVNSPPPTPSYTQPAPAAFGATPAPVQLPSFGGSSPMQKKPEGIDLLSDVNLNVKIELGRTRMLVEDVLRLGEGSVVELDKLAGDPVDVYVNDRHVARGEVLVLNDNFCVRINEIVTQIGDGDRGRRTA